MFHLQLITQQVKIIYRISNVKQKNMPFLNNTQYRNFSMFFLQLDSKILSNPMTNTRKKWRQLPYTLEWWTQGSMIIYRILHAMGNYSENVVAACWLKMKKEPEPNFSFVTPISRTSEMDSITMMTQDGRKWIREVEICRVWRNYGQWVNNSILSNLDDNYQTKYVFSYLNYYILLHCIVESFLFIQLMAW